MIERRSGQLGRMRRCCAADIAGWLTAACGLNYSPCSLQLGRLAVRLVKVSAAAATPANSCAPAQSAASDRPTDQLLPCLTECLMYDYRQQLQSRGGAALLPVARRSNQTAV